MTLLNFFPLLITVESFIAGIICLFHKQYGSAGYWLSATILNISIIYGIKHWG